MPSEERLYEVHFADGLTEQLSLTSLGSGSYRLEESSFFDDSINLGDVIAAEPIDEGRIRFVSVLGKSSYVTLRWAISKKVAESEGLTRFLEQVAAVGGLWEQAMGGMLILHLPQGSAFDAEGEFKLLTG